ncbi:hypothetical protein MSM1_09875 [Mycobacterium sp. SM1]|uniref:hypothetical protein n=1 Tax=Mycobacterium sp. SM1 TaxID=2816243 RepID=UPI001BCBA405|nr:hypothetical protein [Mycobacterium sp. SM1]MBS4728627.1 hypothetical protein [Mycobacterium sp. SM1]
MDHNAEAAAAPRWRGQPGRLEAWYATLSDPLTHAGMWVHYETIAPAASLARAGRTAYAHGWVTWFPVGGPPRTERFGPVPARPAAGIAWFQAAGAHAAPEELGGRAGSIAWALSWKDTGAPLWTFPRIAWEREVLPGAQVVIAPTADFTGSVSVGDVTHHVERWQGGVAHVYGRGNAKRWGWIHADLGDGDVLEAIIAVPRTPAVLRLAPMAFIRCRIDGKDWPAMGLPSIRMRTTLGLRHWQLAGHIGRRYVLVRVDQPESRCVSLQYTDPDGARAVCTNTEQADIYVEIGDRRWSVLGAGHAEVGLRGAEAPAINERIVS